MKSETESCKMAKTLFISCAFAIQTLMMQSVRADSEHACFESSCYKFNLTHKTWDESRRTCKDHLGGDLVSIETEEEWDFINDKIQNRTEHRWHIGLVKENGGWIWVSGRPLTICKSGEPSWGRSKGMLAKNEQQGHLASQVLPSKNVPTLPFICEIPKAIGENSSQISYQDYVEIPCTLEYGKKRWMQNCNFTDGKCNLNCSVTFCKNGQNHKSKPCEQYCSQTYSPLVYQCIQTGHKGNIIFKTCKATKFNLTIGEQHFFTKKTCYCEDDECYTECNKIKCTRTCREKKNWYLNSRIIAVAVDPKPEKLRENVILKFKNLKVLTAEKRCMFWSGLSESFSEKRCHVITSKSNSEETVCSCNHLTHFGVLMDYDGSTKLTEEYEKILETIIYVGLSLSIVGILLTLILYSCLTDVRQPLSQIRLSVSTSLGVGQIIFLAGMNATENKAVCVTIAALMQYFLMTAFCWMLIEGIYLYFFVVKVYNINTKMYMHHVTSWGLPVIMVAMSLGIAAGKEGLQSYTSDQYCWFSSSDNLIWIFVAFVAFIEVLNILILVRVIKEMSNLSQPTGEEYHSQQIRISITACVVMIPLLGVTWVFGLLSPVHKAFAHIFTVLNSAQGFLIFALHCMRNSQIREGFKGKMNIVFPSSIKNNSTSKSSQVNPSEVGDVWAVEMQSCAEFELKSHVT